MFRSYVKKLIDKNGVQIAFLFWGGVGGGLTNERPQTDHVIRGPMRGLEKNRIGRGQTHKQTDTLTLRLLDQLGPEGPVGENS